MSGIYGIYRYDSAPIDPLWLQEMKSAMAYYGLQGGGSCVAGPVGMGHLLLELNPEDQYESQPMRSAHGLIATTARLDNREDLLAEFNILAADASRVSDGHLVRLAFERWGEDVCSYLEGDWSLAAWDATEHRLLLARDVYGSGTLYHYEGKGFVAFASSLKALLALPGVVKEPDRLRLAEVLIVWPYDEELTAYRGFRRLAGAQAMSFAADGKMRTWRHWSPDGREMLKFRRDEEYEEAFLECYTRVLRRCLRTRKPIAAQLSGGRDSGSVVALTAPLLAAQGRSLTAYTSVPFFPPDGAGEHDVGNEWEMAHATATMAGENVRHVPVNAANYGVIQGIKHFLDLHDEPGHAAINHYWCQAVLDAASGDGNGIMLLGGMGNFTVSWPGSGSVLLALRQENPGIALRLLLHGEPNTWLTVKRQVVKPLIEPALLAMKRFRSRFTRPWRAYSALNLQLAKDLDLDARMWAAGHDPTFVISQSEDFRHSVFRPGSGMALGIRFEEEIAARHSLPHIDPTSNRSLLEFLLRVPDDQFYRRGKDTFLFKRTFRSRMPDVVLERKRSGLQAADIVYRIRRELDSFQKCLNSLDSLPAAREILDVPLMHHLLDGIVKNSDPVANFGLANTLVRGVGVGLFLHRFA